MQNDRAFKIDFVCAASWTTVGLCVPLPWGILIWVLI